MPRRNPAHQTPGGPMARATVRCALGLVVALGLTAPVSARAQTEDDIEQAVEAAMEAYDNLELERSQELLEDAVVAAESAELEGPVVTDAFLMLGIVEYALSGDDESVIQLFVEGLALHRDAELNPYYTTPDLEALLERARERVPEPPPEPTNVLVHRPVVTVRAGEPMAIEAGIERGARVDRVILATRSFGQSRYAEQQMMPAGPGQYEAIIPGRDTQGGVQLEYFLEAYDGRGELVGFSGSSSAPHVVIILEAEGGEHPGPGRRLLSAAVGVGTGGGLATGEPVVMGDEVDLNPGMALTPLHFYVDVAFRLADHFELGPFTRLQTVLLQNGVELETIVGAKFKWYFFDNSSPLMYASAGAGWGYVRHTVDLAPTVDFVDTTKEGPFHGGVGFGVAYLFSDHVGFLIDIYTMVLFDTVSVQLDVNAGLYLAF